LFYTLIKLRKTLGKALIKKPAIDSTSVNQFKDHFDKQFNF
jgi:hypothetical protein